jgi:putrescine aminotransferase
MPETVAQLKDWDAQHLWHPWTSISDDPIPMMVKGSGVRVWDSDGKEYLDAKAASLNASCGYSHPYIVEAIHRQASTLMNFSIESASHAPAASLARRYAELLPDPLTRTFFCNSGSEAMETVVKLTRMYHAIKGKPDRRTILTLQHGYHGATLGAVAATDLPLTRLGNEPLPEGYVRVPTPICPTCMASESHEKCTAPTAESLHDAIERIGPDRVGAFVMEPVLGVAGCLFPDPQYLRDASELCDRYGILFVLDEVMTGFGRTGRMFGLEHAEVVPDLIMTSKGVTGGYMPLAAVTTTEEIYSTFADEPMMRGFRHGHTMSGHALACATALAVLEVIDTEGLVENSRRVGRLLLDELSRSLGAEPDVFQVRGLGLSLAVQMRTTDLANKTAAACLKLGLIVRTQGNSVCLLPPLILSESDAFVIAKIFEDAVRSEQLALEPLQ